MSTRKARYFLLALTLGLCLALTAAAPAQRRGSGSRSSRSSRSSGPVYVHGYYRRDGTYVSPHYRSRPDGIATNNWSYSGNVNPFTGKVGTDTRIGYSYGYALPSGAMPDYSSVNLSGEGLRILSAPAGHRLSPTFRIRRYRIGHGEWHHATTWAELGDAAKTGGPDFSVEGVDADGSVHEVSLDVMPAVAAGSQWGELLGATADGSSTEARVLSAPEEANLAAGDIITGLRLLSQEGFSEIRSWADVRAFLSANGNPAEMVARRRRPDGSTAYSVVRTRPGG